MLKKGNITENCAFADNVILLASMICDHHWALGQFAAEFKAARMRASTSMSAGSLLGKCWIVQVQLSLSLVHRWWKHIASDGQVVWCSNSSNAAVVKDHVVKRDLSWKAKLSICQLICFNPNLWSWALGRNRKNEVIDGSGPDEFPPQGPER